MERHRPPAQVARDHLDTLWTQNDRQPLSPPPADDNLVTRNTLLSAMTTVDRIEGLRLSGLGVRFPRGAPNTQARALSLWPGERTEVLRPESRFREAADIWIGKIRERREDSTADTYASCLRNRCSPSSASCAWSSATSRTSTPSSRVWSARKLVQQADGSTIEKTQLAANTRRMVRAIVGGIMQQAVLHQAVATNPVRDLERIESPKGHKKTPPRGLTAEERRRLLAYVDADKTAVRADMPDLIRFALGSGLGIGEICAVRWMDLDLDGIQVVSETDMRLVPVVTIRQNVYPVKGKGLVVHGGKTSTALRIVPLPQFVVTQLRARLHADDDPTWPVFASAGRDGQPTYRWPSNVRRSVRAVREKVDLDWMTPHTWRRTYATILDDEMSLTDRAKADLMGQTSSLRTPTSAVGAHAVPEGVPAMT
jgi:integrase